MSALAHAAPALAIDVADERPLLAAAMGPSWSRLRPAIRALHGSVAPVRASGRFIVRRGHRLLSRILGALFSLPGAGRAVRARIAIEQEGGAVRFARGFGTGGFTTLQTAEGDDVRERHGIVEFTFRPRAVGGALVVEQTGAAIRIGPLRIPFPSFWYPRLKVRVREVGRATLHVAVRVGAPILGLVIAYHGEVEVKGGAS